MTEHQLQSNCVKWFRTQYPKYYFNLFAIPNGGLLRGSKQNKINQWSYFNAEGVVKGVADLFLAIPSGEFNGLFIEMKTTSTSSKQREHQIKFEAAVIENGYGYVIPRTFEQFIEVVKNYLEHGEFN